MAEQNKKSDIEKQVRAEAERIVDRYLKMLFYRDSDAGWGGDNILGRWQDHWGFIPAGSGFSGFSRVYEQTLLLGSWPPRFRVSRKIMLSLTNARRDALCVDRAYRGRNVIVADEEAQRRVTVYFSDKRCAEGMGCSQEALRRRIADGYKAIEQIINPAIEVLAA